MEFSNYTHKMGENNILIDKHFRVLHLSEVEPLSAPLLCIYENWGEEPFSDVIEGVDTLYKAYGCEKTLGMISSVVLHSF